MGHVDVDPGRARRPDRRRIAGGGEPAMARFLAKRLALGLITLLAAERRGLLRRAGAAGQRRPAHPRPVRRPGRGRRAERAARHRPAAARRSTWTGSRASSPATSARRSPRASRCRTSSAIALVALAQAGAAGVRDRRAARDPRRRDRGAERGQRPPTGSSPSAACRRPRCPSSSGRRPDHGLRALARAAADHRAAARTAPSVFTQIKYLLLPALCLVLRAVRLHRPHGARGHDRGARRRLHAHGGAQGPAPAHGGPPPRAAQLAAADDRRRSPRRSAT